MSRGKNGTGISVGSSSILVIFVVLCLTTFATLSLVSARADYKLTQKTAQAASEYYAADAKTEEYLQKLHKGLKNKGIKDNLLGNAKMYRVHLSSETAEEYLQRTGKALQNAEDTMVLGYDVPVNEQKRLHVEFSIELDANGKSIGPPHRLCWQVQPLQEWQDENKMNLAGISNLPIF